LIVAYVLCGQIGLAYASVGQNITLIWVPDGIALAAVIIWGYRMLPALIVGELIGNSLISNTVLSVVAGTVSNPIEAVVGAYLLLRVVKLHREFDRLKDVIGLVFYGATLSTTVSATVGVTGLCATGTVPWNAFGVTWLQWWMGDVMGVILIAPVILTWSVRDALRWSPSKIAEGLSLLGLVVAGSYLAFMAPLGESGGVQPLTYLPFPFLIWAAFRFGARGTTTCALIASAIAVVGASRGVGPFAAETQVTSLWLLVSYMLVLSLTSLVLAAVVAERDRADEQRRDALTKVLSGFIPICASCKSIREAPDRWVSIETYVSHHTEAEFSHGICEKCMKELYPDYPGPHSGTEGTDAD
jgi:integral membrane sensor domain MASE1